MRVYVFRKGINPKVRFELAYYDVTIWYVSHYSMETLLWLLIKLTNIFFVDQFNEFLELLQQRLLISYCGNCLPIQSSFDKLFCEKWKNETMRLLLKFWSEIFTLKDLNFVYEISSTNESKTNVRWQKCIYVSASICVRVYMCMRLCVCVCVCVYVCVPNTIYMYVCVRAKQYIHICVRIQNSIYIYVGVDIGKRMKDIYLV